MKSGPEEQESESVTCVGFSNLAYNYEIAVPDETVLIYQDENYKEILEPDKYNYIVIDDIYNPMDQLGELASNKADSIIFLSDDQVSEAHIDEKPLIYWTNLKKSIRENKNVDIIVEILDAQNQSIIELKNKDQIIVSDDFLGHLYAQLGKNPARLDVIKDMITSNGDSSSLNVKILLSLITNSPLIITA